MVSKLDNLIKISRELASQKDYPKLFKNVVNTACTCVDAEGGTLYLYDEVNHQLEAVVVQNSELKHLDHVLAEFNPNHIAGLFAVKLHHDLSKAQDSISGVCWQTKEHVLITDIKSNQQFDLNKVLEFDKSNNYTTKSILAVPLLNKNENVIGVLQLVNAKEDLSQEENVEFIKSMALLMGIALENNLLLIGMNTLLDSVVKMISSTIDERSKVTGGHSFRVTELTMMVAEEMIADTTGPYKDVSFTSAEMHELKTAALIHDVGKIATPDYVLEKSKKLEQISDRIEFLKMRFKARRLELRILQLEAELDKNSIKVPGYTEEILAEKDDFVFIDKLNTGGEYLTDDARERLENIAARALMNEHKLIEGDDLVNLRIERGTLNYNERKIMEYHAQLTINLLNKLPWPKHLSNVPEIAGKHHENINGSGYPVGLHGNQMSLRAKILSMTDRFEGLSAPDRTYRKPKTLNEVMKIMGFMNKDGHIDPTLFEFFVEREIHIKYAKKYLTPEQLPQEVTVN